MRRQIPRNPGLLALIRAKREWHWKASPEDLRLGFRGWHQRGYLPHFDAADVTQLVTYALADSFPAQRRAEWEPLLREPDTSQRRRQLETWLDRGHGACWMRQDAVADAVEQALLNTPPDACLLRAWCVMPNHVHVIVDVLGTPLSRLVKQWKGGAARAANAVLGRSGAFWQEDYFDTLIRDERHFKQAVRYVEQNPCKAALVSDPRDWCRSSARRRDAFGRLPWEVNLEGESHPSGDSPSGENGGLP